MPGPSFAASPEAQVAASAREFLAAQAEREGWMAPVFDVTVLSKSNALLPCSQPLVITPANTQQRRRMRFAAACADGWRESFTVRAHISAEVVVTTTSLAAGKVLHTHDLALDRRDITNLSDVASDVNAVVGLTAKRALRAGQVIAKSVLVAPMFVKRGDHVQILVSRNGIEVSTVGEALENGQQGSIVRVRNLGTGKIIHARVKEAAIVEPVEMSISP